MNLEDCILSMPGIVKNLVIYPAISTFVSMSKQPKVFERLIPEARHYYTATGEDRRSKDPESFPGPISKAPPERRFGMLSVIYEAAIGTGVSGIGLASDNTAAMLVGGAMMCDVLIRLISTKMLYRTPASIPVEFVHGSFVQAVKKEYATMFSFKQER